MRLVCLSIVLLTCAGARADDIGRMIAPDGAAALQPLTARWWQWRVALPELAAPLKDPAGRFCAVGQSGDIWFLAGYLAAGPGSAKVRRSCIVPFGKRIFFPLATVVSYPKADHTPLTCDRARRQAAARMDTAIDLFAKIDGVAVADLRARRVATDGCFALLEATRPASGWPAAADGYWLLLRPLAAGHHSLRFGGTYAAGSREAGEYQDVTYNLDVR